MITAVDSSVLLDVLTGDASHGEASGRALRASLAEGSVVACDVVWAEISGWFADNAGRRAMAGLRITFDPMLAPSAELAGRSWRTYRAAGGTRQRLVADFLIGAHALRQADRLLTRDRGFYRRYFGDLAIIDSTATAR